MMLCRKTRGLVAVVSCLVASVAAAQRIPDSIKRVDRTERLRGTILRDDLQGVSIKVQGVTATLTWDQIEDIGYGDKPTDYANGEANRRRGAYDAAIPFFQRARSSREARTFWLHPYCDFRVAQCLFHLKGKEAQALAELKKFLATHANARFVPQVHRLLVELYLRLKQPAQTTSHLKWLLENRNLLREGEVWEVRLLAARRLLAEGQREPAGRELDRIVGSCPEKFAAVRLEAMDRLVDVRLAEKKFDEAKVLLEKLREQALAERRKGSNTAALRRILARLYNALGQQALAEAKVDDDHRQALYYFLHVVLLYSDVASEAPDAYYYSIRCFVQLKQKPRAAELAKELKAKYPNYKAPTRSAG